MGHASQAGPSGKGKGKPKLSPEEEVRRRLAAAVTLLSTLNTEPEKPKDNEAPNNSGERDDRQLSFSRERRLAEHFAFLSATTKDATKVMAVSVEEDSDKKGLTVRLASNTGDLSSVKEGLDKIASILQQCTYDLDQVQASAEDTLLREIVRLDYLHILSRLRSCHLPKSQRTQRERQPKSPSSPSSIVLLARLVNATRSTAKTSVPTSTTSRTLHSNGPSPNDTMQQTTHSRVEALLATFEAFEAAPAVSSKSRETQDALMDIIKQSNMITTRGNLDAMLLASPDLNVQMKLSVAEKLRKIGRYSYVSRDLIEGARILGSLFSRISIFCLRSSVISPPTGFTFDHALRCVSESQISINLSRAIESYMAKPIKAVQRDFERQLESTTRWKIHAEIQLLLFYESNHAFRTPRVICSSKKACYMCNLFIRNHGTYFIPRTHGKIYDKWTLPPSFTSISTNNVRHIRRCIEQTVSDIEAKIMTMLQGKRQKLQHPNESFPGLSEPWSSNASRDSAEQAILPFPYDIGQDEPTERTSLQNDPDDSDDSASTLRDATRKEVKAQSPAQGTRLVTTPVPYPLRHSDKSEPPACILGMEQLTKGLPLCRKLEQPNLSIAVGTNAMNMELSWDSRVEQSTTEASLIPKTCWIQVLWCHSFEAHSLHDSETVDLAAIEHDLIESEAGAAQSVKDLIVRKGEEAVKVKFTFNDPTSGDR